VRDKGEKRALHHSPDKGNNIVPFLGNTDVVKKQELKKEKLLSCPKLQM
jgi:hypothetical protein